MRVARYCANRERARPHARDKCVTMNREVPPEQLPFHLVPPHPPFLPSSSPEYYLVIVWIICRAITRAGTQACARYRMRLPLAQHSARGHTLVIASFFFFFFVSCGSTVLHFRCLDAICPITRDFRTQWRDEIIILTEAERKKSDGRRWPAEIPGWTG